jgi:hypothetical protein
LLTSSPSMNADGTPKPPRPNRQEDAVPDGHSGHRPEFHDAERAKRIAYDEMVRDLTTAWKTPKQKLADARLTTDAQRPQGMTDAEFEYRRMVAEMNDAWRPKDAAPARVTPVPTVRYQSQPFVGDALDMHRPGFRSFADGEAAKSAAYEEYVTWLQDEWKPRDSTGTEKLPPYGGWPLWSQVEGSSCTLDGANGVWTREGDYLFCKPINASETPISNGDARPRTMSPQDAQAIKDTAYREMCNYLENAWRTPG